MDGSESWEPGAPEHRVWTQGPWHGAPAGQGPAGHGARQAGPAGQDAWDRDPWNAGPGFGEDGVLVGDWTVATAAARTLAHRALRVLLLFALAGFAFVAGLVALAVAVWPHGVLAVLLVLLAVPVLLVSLATAAAIWVGRRAWRSGAWLEAVPMVAGMPWLSRVIWAVRAALVGRAFWRFGRRARRPSYQPRAGDLSGTTR
jgi:hypothetical protein